MKELTIVLDSFGHKELKDYLNSLNGILEVVIKNEKNLEIYVKYNPKLITSKILKDEIYLFLDILKVPSMIAFDKHAGQESRKYLLDNEKIHCCEYCLKGTIEDLFETNGIEKVECNYFTEDNPCKFNESIIEVSYNSDIIDEEDIKRI